ncbi:molybdopterin-synthase adenylyltransferase MoeB [Rhodobacterales bacterium HKCCE2091]|nr:molybdopterin-synthase adenylyltransferase MoeB [Rhodobacterales bacterium HKCCE2091]
MGLLLLLVVAGIIALGPAFRVPWTARLYMLGLLYVAVLSLHLLLPDGHPMREGLGGSAAPWLILGVLGALALAYRAILQVVRRKATATQEARAPAASPKAAFTDDELERYARHITLPEVGGAGQRKLKAAKVLVVGAGGLGAPALLYLAAAGVGRIGVIDPDAVELSNLQRQVIHSDDRQGMPKVFSAQAAIAALNPFVEVRPYHRALTAEIAPELFAEYDLILDGTDRYDTRAMVNRAAVDAGKPLIAGAISAWEGQLTLYDPARGAPCLACVFPDPPPPDRAATCAETGVIGALPGVVGSMMALEAVKELTGAGEGLRGRMLIHDALHAETRSLRIARDPACPVCGGT